MGLFTAIDAAASGMTAERLRMDVISNNIANANTTRTPEGGPYRRQMVIFQPRAGQNSFADLLSGKVENVGVRVVGIVKDEAPFRQVFDPNHPDANAAGYVAMPNVNIIAEMVDMMTAARAYEANVTAINAAKSMALKALEIGR
ncbi:flagellar basal-body rod protein FlgC [Thermosinus carboxydivorans Nor1]|uniref:Flagellar basal-body rod protein FlgC n=1 Tax=Thermosinus carboxydivorans Nor1 TaxID=401526 RepID=A1HN44_9FIRM|nr:flagellar basal body rod protein FlgC [Thermosinus carboxydivorans]EAX48671.1 flagellar basal-body rod protein FlgC [Thermosinus carboxydivorans Nor1]